jgi:hypothetical protein
VFVGWVLVGGCCFPQQNNTAADEYARPNPTQHSPKQNKHQHTTKTQKKHSWQDLKDFFRPIGDVGFTDVDQRNGEGVVEFMYKVCVCVCV